MKQIAILISLVAAGCGETAAPAPTPPPPPTVDAAVRLDAAVPGIDAAAPMTVEVRALDTLQFSPANITIPRGSTVRWVNAGTMPHTVTSGTSSRDTNVGRLFDMALDRGGTVQFTFNNAGTFPYFCRIHEGFNMRGTVTVTP